jgi:glycosyltransferase involved in cell wall biosynthesis
MTDRPLTIVHTEASCGWGGQDMRVLRECEWFRAQGHTVYIVTPPEAELFRRAKAAGFDPVPMAFTKKTQLGDFFRLRAFFKKVRPDVVGTHSSVDSRVGLYAAASLGVKCRLRYRHVSSTVKRNPLTRWQYARLATHVITTGDSISRHLVETLGIRADKISCVSTGVEAPANLPSREEARLAICREHGLPEDARFIGQVSVLRSWKGHLHLFDAFEKLAAEFPRLHLLLVGDGPQREPLTARKAASPFSDRIVFRGHRENPWPDFLALDACALCSVSGEGIPQALMQAMLVGTPVIGTTTGGIPEVVADGEGGIIVPPADPEALAAGLRRLLSAPDETTRMARYSLERTRRERSPDAMGGAITTIIRNDLAR